MGESPAVTERLDSKLEAGLRLLIMGGVKHVDVERLKIEDCDTCQSLLDDVRSRIREITLTPEEARFLLRQPGFAAESLVAKLRRISESPNPVGE